MAPSTMASAGTPTTTMMPRPTVLLMEESWPLSPQREYFMQLQRQSVSKQHNTLNLQVNGWLQYIWESFQSTYG